MTFDTIPVPVGKCRCPGEPHGGGDVVYLPQQASMPGGMAIKAALTSNVVDPLEAQYILARAYFGEIDSWTFTDEDDDPIPVTPENAKRLLPWANGGREVADKADDLYIADVAIPFIAAMKKLKVEQRKLNREQRRRSGRGPTPKSGTGETPSSPTSSTPTSISSRRKSS